MSLLEASKAFDRIELVSVPNSLRPLRDLQYGLGETVIGGCRHLEYMNIWGFNEPKYYFVCLREEAQMGFLNVFLLRFLSKACSISEIIQFNFV